MARVGAAGMRTVDGGVQVRRDDTLPRGRGREGGSGGATTTASAMAVSFVGSAENAAYQNLNAVQTRRIGPGKTSRRRRRRQYPHPRVGSRSLPRTPPRSIMQTHSR